MDRGRGLVRRQRHACRGNGALLVLTDSSGPYWDFAIVDETVLVALEHFGMPYRVLDLAGERVTAEKVNDCAGVIIAQNRLGARLDDGQSAAIADAVAGGVGFVSFDNDLGAFKAPLLEMFAFERINPHPYATNMMRIRHTGHYVTAMQSPGEFHTFDRMVTAVMVEKWGPDVMALAEGVLAKDQLIYTRHLSPWSAYEPRNHALLFAGAWGRGRAVQFALNPRVWRGAFFGHARGIDDLFWRSIVWAARKPFAANMIPPFVVMSFDDGSGRHDFGHVDVANRHGYKPTVALFLRNVPERLFPKIRDGLRSRTAQYCTHALDYYTLLAYDFGKGDYTDEQLKKNFAFEDDWWRRVGAAPGLTIRFHWGEYGANSLPFFKQRGRTFLCPALQTGLHKADMCMGDGFWPYGLQTCYYDYLPDDHDFFGFAAMLPRHQEDFLIGCTAILRESERNDIEKAALSAARCIQHGLRAGFFGELVTHEQKFDVVSMAEWDRILTRTGELIGHCETIHATHDEVALYLKGKDGVFISEAAVKDGELSCTLAGKTASPLRLSQFSDEDDGVTRQYTDVSAFDGEATIG